MAADTRVIKRYSNRKLYDTQRSRYVTLDQISEMIRHGEDVKIIDNNTKEDLTSITLAQIIFEEEKKQKSFLSLSAMRQIIQSGGEALQEASARMRSVFRRERDGEGGMGDDGMRPAGLKEFLEQSQKTFDEWQKRVDERVRTVVEGVSPFAGLQKDVSALSTRIAELEKRLEEIAREP